MTKEDFRERAEKWKHGITMDSDIDALYDELRNDVLEEAAKRSEGYGMSAHMFKPTGELRKRQVEIAEAIRSLKTDNSKGE